ncbi:CMRF35-like molecule 8 isoform X3 [Salmo trutta]|uniref:CMRF35-like molecule 8 isoform X3 n=1 Tax=Salmo trutta TaxID=8032 RepID=UPI001132742D|nr:CMRF35-like molecule 8 isoform X3 [Salmo trutta]
MVILLVLTLKIVLLLAAVWSVCAAELITGEGYKGGKAKIRCPYREEWRSHQKYLCKGSKMECITFLGDNDIETEDEEWTSKWRYSLHDDKGVRVFIVTITNMVSDGAGTYWCGVERFGLDPEVYGDWCCENPSEVTGSEEVTVSIHFSPTLSSPPTATSQPTANSISPSSILPSTHNRSDTSVVIIVSGTLIMLLLVLVFSLLIVYRGKFNKETADSSAPRVNTDTRINREGCHGDGEYEEIKDRPRQSSSGGETTTVYATANLPTRPFDSLNYANVNFHKNPSCPNEATVAIAKEGTSPGDYATVNIGQSPAYSTVNHPHSTSEAPPIYYIVSKPRDP